MKTVYLHMGTPKTATSSIQHLCRNNRGLLHKYGYSFEPSPFRYPQVGINRNAHFLVGPRKDEKMSPEQKAEYEERLKTGLSLVRDQLEKNDNVILTDENLWWSVNYAQWNGLQILKEDADAHNYCVKVIVYLRRQDNYLISRWNQLIKERKISEQLPKHLKKVLFNEPLIVYYDESLARIAALVGKENVIVRRFERESWVNQNIYDDFKNAIGLDQSVPLKLPKQDENPSLKNNFIELQRIINGNKRLSPAEKDDISVYLRRASIYTEERNPTTLMSPEERQAFLLPFEDRNSLVAAEYIGDGKPLFSSDMEQLLVWEPETPSFFEDATAFLLELPPEKRKLFLSGMTGKGKTAYLSAMISYLETADMDQKALKKKIAYYKKYAQPVLRVKNVLQRPASILRTWSVQQKKQK